MKNSKKHTPHKHYEVLQEILNTYRYPDGTLNRIAIFISALALTLLLTGGHFIIKGIKSIRDMNTVDAAELNASEIEDYITNSYLKAIGEYADGDINQEVAKRKILLFLAEYINSSNGFTTQQNEALNEIINQYLTSSTIYSDVTQNSKDIKTLSSLIESKYQENTQYINELKTLLENELASNSALDESNKKDLQKAIDDLRIYLDNQNADSVGNLNSIINELRRTYEKSLGAQEYVPGATYKKGDYVIYNEHLYVSKADDNSSSPENGEKWELTTLETILGNLEKTMIEELSSTEAKLVESINTVNQDLSQNLDSVNKNLSDSIDSVNSNLSNNIDSVNANLTDNINEVNTSLTDNINEVNQNLSNDINNVNTNLSNNIDSVTNNLNSVNQTLTTEDENLRQMINQINDRISDNNLYFEFGYDTRTGSYGYYVGKEFKPW